MLKYLKFYRQSEYLALPVKAGPNDLTDMLLQKPDFVRVLCGTSQAEIGSFHLVPGEA